MVMLIMVFLLTRVLADTCIDPKYAKIPGHTGCLPKSQFAQSKVVTAAEQAAIVNLHNQLRATVNATNMQKMVWDNEVAALAQKWTDNCVWAHDQLSYIPDRFSLGQNLGLGHQSWDSVISSWFGEKKYFVYGNATAMNFAAVGHYTQVTWAESAKVGCGLTICSNLPNRGLFYACNYGPAGNLQWWKPYDLNGVACSKCASKCDKSGLCDCGGKVCENGGTLDLNTCQCRCVKPWYEGAICKLNCAVAKDSTVCGTQWPASYCTRFTNVPQECPMMCKVCPAL